MPPKNGHPAAGAGASPAPASAPPAASPPAPPPGNQPRDELQRLQELAALVGANPGAYQPCARASRVPANGDGREALFVAEIPLAELGDAPVWLARTQGPGIYRVDVIDTGRRFVGSVMVRVAADLRPPAPPAAAPAPAASAPTASVGGNELMAVLVHELRALGARIERLEGGHARPSMPSAADPMTDLERLVGITSKLPGAPKADELATNAEKLVRLGLDVGKAQAGGAGMGAIIEKHLPDILALGKSGLDVMRDVVTERRAKREAAHQTQPEVTVRTNEEDEHGRHDGAGDGDG